MSLCCGSISQKANQLAKQRERGMFENQVSNHVDNLAGWLPVVYAFLPIYSIQTTKQL